jgi:hypothetical protein
MKHLVTTLLSLVTVLVLAGCASYVAPEDRALISRNASNARVFAEKALTAEPPLPGYVAEWLSDDAKGWTELEKWSNSHTGFAGIGSTPAK